MLLVACMHRLADHNCCAHKENEGERAAESEENALALSIVLIDSMDC